MDIDVKQVNTKASYDLQEDLTIVNNASENAIRPFVL